MSARLGDSREEAWIHSDAMGLVVYRMPGDAATPWALCHAASGEELARFRSLHVAQRVAIAVAPLTDWTQPDEIVQVSVDPFTVGRVIAVVRRREGDL